MNITIAILHTSTGEPLAVPELSQQVQAETRVFADLGALEAWLRRCRDNAQSIAAVLVDDAYFEINSKRIIFSSILAIKNIPLIVVGATYGNSHWCEIGAAVRAGMPVYLTTASLLPSLLAHLCQPASTKTVHHSSQSKGMDDEKTHNDRGRFGHGTTDDRFYPA